LDFILKGSKKDKRVDNSEKRKREIGKLCEMKGRESGGDILKQYYFLCNSRKTVELGN